MRKKKTIDPEESETETKNQDGGDELPSRDEIIKRRLEGMNKEDADEEKPEKPAQSSKVNLPYSELEDKYLRLMADYKNYQNRTVRDRQRSIDIALKGIMLDVLRNLDHLELAMQSAEKDKDIDGLCKGIKMIEEEFMKTLEGHGLTRIETGEQFFDPEIHEAVMSEETSEFTDELITQELKKGYMLKDMVIRPSMVKVAKNPDMPRPPKEESEEEPKDDSADKKTGDDKTAD